MFIIQDIEEKNSRKVEFFLQKTMTGKMGLFAKIEGGARPTHVLNIEFSDEDIKIVVPTNAYPPDKHIMLKHYEANKYTLERWLYEEPEDSSEDEDEDEDDDEEYEDCGKVHSPEKVLEIMQHFDGLIRHLKGGK